MYSNRGYSLVELSVVLVIIGLLVGAVMLGQDLVRGAQLRSVGVDLERFTSTTKLFKEQYQALPGDKHDATELWGQVGDSGTGTCSNSSTSAHMGVGTETCNGNGDGDLGTRTEPAEAFRFWQQLANAKLIEGQYAGVGDDGSGDGLRVSTTIEAILPQLPFARFNELARWGIWAEAGHVGTFYSATNKYLYRNAFMLDQALSSGANRGLGSRTYGVMTPREAYQIDSKLDDGLPAKGKIHAGLNISPTLCSTTTDPATAKYKLDSASTHCGLYFITDF